MVWKPHVTVAAVIEQNQRYLLVEELIAGQRVFNQPAGHLEPGESLIEAVIREVQEETAWRFTPEAFLPVMLWRKSAEAPSFLRFCFTGTVDNFNPEQALDKGIIQTHWLSQTEVSDRKAQLRSSLVLNSIENYQNGQRYPLSILQTFLDCV